jgi:hypothetical protein
MPRRNLLRGAQLSLFDLGMLGSSLEPNPDQLHPNMMQPSEARGAHHWIEEKYVKRGKKQCGPYRYLRWRQDGKLKSKYLGKAKRSPDQEPN